MDFNLKQWRDESEEEDQKPPQKLLLNSHPHTPALPLFFSEPNTNLSAAYSSDHHPNTPSATKFPRMGSYFSLSQWEELELQALIFRHMIAGAAVPHELLHLVKKSLINSASSYYLSSPLHQYYPHYQPALLHSGYWGRGGMDPEPGRCRRTDGKKWRCSRDVVAGQKYCERHMHRGRNRSRKPVEIPTSEAAAAATYAGREALKSNYSVVRQGVAAGDGGNRSSFTLTTTSHSTDLLHLNQRPCDSIIEAKGLFEPQNDGQSSGRTLRHFFDDWPKPLHETDNAANYSATNLSISMPENSPSDFSLKLGTGGVGDDEPPSPHVVSGEGDNKPQLNWGGMGMAWENNPVAPMGGPLAEALRSSASNSSSPTSVLHRLQRGTVSEASYVTS